MDRKEQRGLKKQKPRARASASYLGGTSPELWVRMDAPVPTGLSRGKLHSRLKKTITTGRYSKNYAILNPSVEEYHSLASLPHPTPAQTKRMEVLMDKACGAALRMCEHIAAQACLRFHLPSSVKDEIESDCVMAMPRIITAWRPQPSDKSIPEEEHRNGRSSVSAWTWWCLQRRASSTAWRHHPCRMHRRYQSCWGMPITSGGEGVDADDGTMASVTEATEVTHLTMEHDSIKAQDNYLQAYSLKAIHLILAEVPHQFPDVRETTRLAFDMRLDGLSYKAIAKRLTKLKRWKRRGRGTQDGTNWDEKAVDNLLCRTIEEARRIINEKKWKILAGEFKTLVEASTQDAV